MKTLLLTLLAFSTIILGGCSVFGRESVEIARYKTLETHKSNIEIREYPTLVMAVSQMNEGEKGENTAFRNLFDYISGENTSEQEVAMTAPVIMNESNKKGEKIAMTAPVFMNEDADKIGTMAFVLPSKYTLETAPNPLNYDVKLVEQKLGIVAVIRFSGLLDKNAQEQTQMLKDWIANSQYEAVGEPLRAGYNSPWAIPATRRNEIIIPVKKK